MPTVLPRRCCGRNCAGRWGGTPQDGPLAPDDVEARGQDDADACRRHRPRQVAEQDETAAFERPTDGYALFNADLVVTPFEARDVKLILGVRNITDEEARIHSSFLKEQVPLAGRSVRLAIRSAF